MSDRGPPERKLGNGSSRTMLRSHRLQPEQNVSGRGDADQKTIRNRATEKAYPGQVNPVVDEARREVSVLPREANNL